MSISIIGQPQNLSPAYNPNYWYFDSTDKTEKAYRYIVEVYEQGTNRLIGTYKLRPRPTDLYGEVDLSKLLSSEFEKDFQTDTIYHADKHDLNYYLEVNEEYIVEVDSAGIGFAGAINWPDFSDPSVNPNGSSRTAALFSSNPIFEAGDIINIAQNNVIYPQYEGVHTVLDKFFANSFWHVVLDIPWVGTGSNSPSLVTYADGQKTIIVGVQSGNKTVVKSAFPFNKFINYSGGSYTANSSNKNFLSLMPESVRISRKIQSWICAFTENTSRLYYDIDGTLYRTSFNTDEGLMRYGVLPLDINEYFDGTNWLPFTGTLNIDNIESYKIAVFGAVQHTKWKTVTLYSECDLYDTFDLTFLDMLGNYITIPFYKGYYVNQNVSRETYRKKYGDLSGEVFAYSLDDQGTKVYHTEEDLIYNINTGQLSVSESEYLSQIIKTGSAFISINGEDFRAIIIQNSNNEIYNKRTTRERKLSIDFKFAVNDKTNV